MTLIPSKLTDEVVSRYKDCPDPRLKEIMISLVKHLHSFAREVKLTEAEWIKGVEYATRVGQFCDETRQEFILLSDVLGLEMTVVELNHGSDAGETEATLLGPFYVPGAPELPKGATISDNSAGEPLDVTGEIQDQKGKAIVNALIDVWQAGRTGFTRARIRTSRNSNCAATSAPIATAPIISNQCCQRATRFRPMGRWAI